MNYVFTFIGEFGYELFNWQGVIRKWAQQNKKKDDKIIICSRQGLESIYEFADHYINISQLKSYNNTVADCYRAYIWKEKKDLPFEDWPIIGSGPAHDELINNIKNDVKQQISLYLNNKSAKYIWSCDYIQMDNFHFGHGGPGGGSIYSNGKFLNNNKFIKIDIPNFNNIKNKLQKEINLDLDSPYILCQTGYRGGHYTEKSNTKIDHNKIFNNLQLDIPILYLNFNSGRYFDSTSNFEVQSYSCNNFNEQACLISLSSYCIFTTEGDFRSHTYIPPMLGKDVHVVASNEVLKLPSESSNFWNKNIFHFGGEIYTYEYEKLKNWKLK
tara:strand:- start:274 stop:1254 length:981 start_codon:yes stop_codon:yes gene_type:complete